MSNTRSVRIPKVEITEIRNVHLVSGSELICIDGVFYVDSSAMTDAQFRNSQDDERILAVGQNEVVLTKFNLSEPVRIKELFFAAYPTTEVWGEWFTFVLSRLAVLSECFPNRRMDVAILDSVPENFVNIAEQLFPRYTFIKLPRGMEVLVERALFIPAWHAMNSQEYWSMEGDRLRLQLELKVSELLRKCIEQVIPNTGSSPSKIFYNRAGARYRRGATESVLSLLAEKHNYQSVNMGALSLADQVSISRSGVKSFGQCGSNWDLVATTAMAGHSSMIVHHDRPHEWQGVAWVYGEFAGAPPQFVLGSRRIPAVGYGPESYHQAVELSKENIDYLDEKLGSGSF